MLKMGHWKLSHLKFMTIDGVGNSKTERYNFCIIEATAPIHLSISHYILPSLVKPGPKILKLLHLKQAPTPEWGVLPFSDRAPRTENWKWKWFSFQLLHTQLQTIPLPTAGPDPKDPTRQHRLRNAAVKCTFDYPDFHEYLWIVALNIFWSCQHY